MTNSIRRVPRGMVAPDSVEHVKDRVLAVAQSQVGYREGADNDNAFGLWYGYNRVAWCAQFVSWAAFVAAVPTSVIPKFMYTPTGWNWFRAADRDVSSPQRGDVFFVYGLPYGETKPRVKHVGFVRAVSGGRISTVEGNTNNTGSVSGNGVYNLSRPIDSRLRFARPDYAKAVIATPPAVGGGSGDVAETVQISLKACQYSALNPGQYLPGGTDDVVNVKAFLVRHGIALSTDGFRTAYRKWQLHLNYTGSDADGVPGSSSLNVLCKSAGWVMVA